MNYGRLVGAAAAATFVDSVYGFLVYGMVMKSEFERYPLIYRPEDVGPSYLPLMFAGIFVAMCVVTAIYAKGYEGGSGAVEGARFGVLFGLFAIFFYAGVNYATMNIGRKLAVMYAAAGFVEWILAGTVIGVTYKPAVTASPRRSVGV